MPELPLHSEIEAIQEQVRENPSNHQLRVHLFQLYAQAGEWSKSNAQLQMARSLNEINAPLALIYAHVLKAEETRASVFAGTGKPTILGDEKAWTTLLLDALREAAKGNLVEAAEIRAHAMDSAEAASGMLNDVPFSWIADADNRLGPVLEAFVHDSYHWIPFEEISEIKISPPANVHDLIWSPVQIILCDGKSVSALVPARYPLSTTTDEKAHLLSKLTTWTQDSSGDWIGHGVRVIATDTRELSILDIRHIKVDPRPSVTQ